MIKKVLVISTSMRKNSNYDILADEFIKGAKSKGHSVEKICIKEKNISFCKGCLSCQVNKKCSINDDAQEIFEKIKNSNVIVWATPIYYYSMSGQMKTLIDRLNPLFVSKYDFQDIYLIATAADNNNSAFNGIITELNGWTSCLTKTKLKGILKATSLTYPSEAKEHPNYLKEAYKMGENI